MKRALILAMALALPAAALAQQFKWVDKNGRVQYGDTPPPGVQATPLGGSSAPAPQPASQSKGPPSLKEQEAEFRRRQQEAGKEREKQAQAAEEAAAKKENCSRARESLRTLESGQRVARSDAKGERYYLDDAQIAQETAKARQSVQQWCS